LRIIIGDKRAEQVLLFFILKQEFSKCRLFGDHFHIRLTYDDGIAIDAKKGDQS